jgi:hypothetical protein
MFYKILESHKKGDITIIDKAELDSTRLVPYQKEGKNVLSNS